MGIAVLALVGGIFLVLGLMYWQARKIGQYREKIVKCTDRRCRATEEMVGAINIVKMYCWESAFLEKIINSRQEEIFLIKQKYYLGHIWHRLLGSFGKLLAIATFAIYFTTISIKEFKSSNLFVVQSFIEDLNWQIGILFWTAFTITEAMVSIKRVQEILLLAEKPPMEEKSGKFAVEFEDLSAYFHGATEPFFKNLNLQVTRGDLVGIIGPVGCGKSSLFSIVLGEMQLKGNYKWDKPFGYCPQESWIFVGSIRENILIGREFNKKKYSEVIKVCCLEPDFENFQDKDQTIVGEKGVTLSGGQKARINLARAVYSDAELYLLDDPLAAVDTKVANYIFENVITNYLKSKTVIMVTHHVDLLENADKIICLDSGKIIFDGKYPDLKNSKNDFLKSLEYEESEVEENSPKQENKTNLQTEEGIITDEEEKIDGELGFSFFINYLFMCGSKALVYLWLFCMFLTQVVQVLSDLQLAVLGNTGDIQVDNCIELNITCDEKVINSKVIMDDLYWYIGIFGLYLIVSIVTVIQFVNITMRTCQNVHDVSIASVIKASMDFFHANPSGRVMNRFTKDLGIVDERLIEDTDETLYCGFQLIGIMTVTVATMWFSIVIVIPLCIMILFIRQYYIKTARELKRIEGMNQSPVFAHFSESINGRILVNAFQIKDWMTKKMNENQDIFGSPFVTFIQLNRWLMLRLDFLCCIFFIILSLTFVIIYDNEDIIKILSLTASTIGLSLSKTYILLGTFQWFIRKSCEAENDLTNLERILEYSLLPDEDENDDKFTEKKVSFNRKEAKTNLEDIINRKNIVTEKIPDGKISFESFNFGYKTNKMVLKDLNLEIKAGEKIGIVGRTGAGKSSMISALFRMRNPAKGDIILDGKSAISEMSLLALRRNISIIPQEPFIFCDSFRRNVDPLGQFGDSEIWSVLENVGLSDKVKESENALDYHLEEKGSNLSVGEKQLLCLARATLKHNKILLIDEATANVDLQTDDFIQKTLAKEFQDSTVLTVAHRLKTIINSDRVLVLDHGRIIEFDTPLSLLKDTKSSFHALVRSSKDSKNLYKAIGLNGTQF